MAKKTFTIDSAGVTAGQALDDISTVAKIQGDLGGAEVFIEASDTDGDYVTVSGGAIPQNVIETCRLPAGWYVRARVVLGDGTPSATLTIE